MRVKSISPALQIVYRTKATPANAPVLCLAVSTGTADEAGATQGRLPAGSMDCTSRLPNRAAWDHRGKTQNLSMKSRRIPIGSGTHGYRVSSSHDYHPHTHGRLGSKVDPQPTSIKANLLANMPNFIGRVAKAAKFPQVRKGYSSLHTGIKKCCTEWLSQSLTDDKKDTASRQPVCACNT